MISSCASGWTQDRRRASTAARSTHRSSPASETDPRTTSLTWRRVRLYNQQLKYPPKPTMPYQLPTKASERRKNDSVITPPSSALPTKTSGGRRNETLITPPASTLPDRSTKERAAARRPVSRPRDSSNASGSLTPSESASKITSRSSRNVTARVDDDDFYESILRRYNIVIPKLGMGGEEDAYGSAYDCFDTNAAPMDGVENVTKWYHEQHERGDSLVWLSLALKDAEKIAESYKIMRLVEEQEAKYSLYAKYAFFKQDIAQNPTDPSKQRSTYCKVEWAPTPNDEMLLYCPPQSATTSSEKSFKFQNKPDLTYWIPILAFNEENRQRVSRYTFVVPGAQVIAPYLTVEFKKSDQKKHVDVALNQIAASAALVLYNRVQLRLQRLNKFHQKWTEEETDAMKHYGIAFASNIAQVYEIRPLWNEEMTWSGCKMEYLCQLDVSSPTYVLKLCQWINEIHNWGLGKHIDELEVDLKGIFLPSTKLRRARPSLLASQAARLGLSKDDERYILVDG